MEMQQIRYFLALAETLNFTRAAEECNVSQPALTRAIQALEFELGGNLIRREGRNSHITELGKRMLPLMRRCYESAISAVDLARAVAKNEVAPLSLALSHSVNLELFMAPIAELFRTIPGLQLRLFHGSGSDILAALKQGGADLAIASAVEDGWERLDRWPLFSEGFEVALHADHPLAQRDAIDVADLSGQSLFRQTGSEDSPVIARWFDEGGAALTAIHEVDSCHHLGGLLQASSGVAIVPASAPRAEASRRVKLKGLGLSRTVYIYGVAGRLRSAPATALLTLLRSADKTYASAA